MRPDRDAGQLGRLAGGDSVAEHTRDGGRSRLVRVLAVVALMVAALAVVIGPHVMDSARISSVADRAADQARGDTPAVSCPPDPLAHNTVRPISTVVLRAAVICHYPGGEPGTRPVEGQIPTSQLAEIGADLRARTSGGPWSEPPGLAVPESDRDDVLLFAVTARGQRVQLMASPYPRTYAWGGPGHGPVWHPSPAVRQLLADDLPR